MISPSSNRQMSTAAIPGPPPRQLSAAPDLELAALHRSLLAPGDHDADSERISSDVLTPMVFRFGGRKLRLFSTITTFGTSMDSTLDEVSIESDYPADDETAAHFAAS